MLHIVQRAGRWAFQLADTLFNRAFGDRLNPLYHLGALTWWMFWLVVASGLYLYVFFRTGIEEAYDSVERLTIAQWWLGGIMRSVHRYASDALVLTMLLHLVRHFVFDHHRGYRWFSWLTGGVLMLLVCASGVNGYMLPWDQLGQFVVIATAEWLDWLPVFSGALIRNFIAQDALTDRLWSLLSFIHIGLPLGVLLLMWIHTQRVAAARTLPPQPLAIASAAGMVILAVMAPVTSHGGRADLGSAIATIDLDWFYLGIFALLYEWTPGVLWAFVGGTTLLFVLLPWLPPKPEGEGVHMLAHPDNRMVPVREGERLLEAALREGMPVPFECRYGGCGLCKGTLLSGRIDYGLYQASALTGEERSAGKFLLCTALPLCDVEIEYVPVQGPGRFEVKVFTARVASMRRLAPDVMRVLLEVEGGAAPQFYAGQYLNVLLPGGQKRSFSFANAPHERGAIELHIRRIPGGLYTTHVFTAMKEGDRLRFEGPLGSFFLREESERPILFVAGATGFAPVKSMVEYAFHVGMKREMRLYWGTRTLADLYLRELPERWAREHAQFTFVPVLSEPRAEDRWTGRTGLIHEAILADFPDLSGQQVYACGSVEMVHAVRPAFLAHGMSEHDCYSDAFQLAPQAQSPAPELVRLGGRS